MFLKNTNYTATIAIMLFGSNNFFISIAIYCSSISNYVLHVFLPIDSMQRKLIFVIFVLMLVSCNDLADHYAAIRDNVHIAR